MTQQEVFLEAVGMYILLFISFTGLNLVFTLITLHLLNGKHAFLIMLAERLPGHEAMYLE